jgi:hypothetical protein
MQNIPRGVTTSSIPINSLQGDLQPLLFLNGFFVGRINTTEAALNQIVFSPQVTEATILFTARWSDQSFPRNPALQGQRIALVRLLNPEGYTIPSGFNAQARITLDDPVNVPPVVQNSLCRQFQPILVSNVQTFFSSVEPGFYDDNYDSLSYMVVSSNEVLMRSRGVLNGVAAFEVLPPSSILWQSSHITYCFHHRTRPARRLYNADLYCNRRYFKRSSNSFSNKPLRRTQSCR